MLSAHSSTCAFTRPESDCRILWVGSQPPKVRIGLDESRIGYAFEHLETLEKFSENHTNAHEYDCAVVNFEKDNESQYLRFASLLATRSFPKVFVLAPTEKIQFLAALPGVTCVFENPVSATTIVKELDRAFADGEESSDVSQDRNADDNSAASASQNPANDETSADSVPAEEDSDTEEQVSSESKAKGAITEGFETSISFAREVDHSIWHRFLPVVNFLYKKLAILALGSLFLTFLAYGAMIIFYLSNSSWTLPFELSAGNKIVQKVERDLSQMRLSQNLVRQQLTVNGTELSNAARKERQGRLQIEAIKKTITEEIYSKQRVQKVTQEQIDRLLVVEKKVMAARGQSDLPSYFKSLKKLLKKKIVSRRAVETVRLTLIEAEHRLASMRNEIADKKEQLALSKRQEGHLQALLSKINSSELIDAPTLDAKFSHMAADLMAARTATLTATSEIFAAKKREGQLQDSLQLVTGSIKSIVQTPAARAIEEPVAVLFVPYQNSDAVVPDKDLYGCSFFIFICKKVGTLGSRVDGESVSSHPLFDKPMRGFFVEAKFDDPTSVTEEILHIGGAPVLF